MKFDLDPTIPKVIIIALLLFAEGLAIPVITIVQQGRWPSVLEAFGFFLTAFVQLCTFFVTFLKTGETTEPKKT